jgi:hypothetical protein
MSSFSLSVRRSSVCFTVSNGGGNKRHVNDDMTFVSPPLETGKHTDERRTDNENDNMTFVSLSLVGEKQASCHHSHCLYVVRLYVLLSLMGRNKRHVIILIVCTSFVT